MNHALIWQLQISQRYCRSPSGSTWCWCRRSVSASHSLTWTCTFGNDRLFQAKPEKKKKFNQFNLHLYYMHFLKTANFLLLSEWTSSLTWTSAKLGSSTCVFLRWAGYCGDLTGPSCFSWGAVVAVQGRALNTQDPKLIYVHTHSYNTYTTL